MRRRLDVELVRRGLVPSCAVAAQAVAAGRVLVGGAPADRAARQVAPGESLAVTGPPRRFVSRGGEKLESALDAFGVGVTGARALDAGASTGGFTHCLLARGARHVVAVDVGRGQLAWSLRRDPRVTVLEGTNVRELEPARLGGRVRLVTVDLAFISLLAVTDALVRCTMPGGEVIALVKPQFETRRAEVGRGGIVRDPAVHAEVLRRVAEGLNTGGLSVVNAVASALRGHDGNQEFFVHCRRGARPAPLEQIAAPATRGSAP